MSSSRPSRSKPRDTEYQEFVRMENLAHNGADNEISFHVKDNPEPAENSHIQAENMVEVRKIYRIIVDRVLMNVTWIKNLSVRVDIV